MNVQGKADRGSVWDHAVRGLARQAVATAAARHCDREHRTGLCDDVRARCDAKAVSYTAQAFRERLGVSGMRETIEHRELATE